MILLGKIQEITSLVEGKLNQLGIDLVEVQYRKENAEQMLRFFVDTDNGVDLELCTQATRAIKPLLDDGNIFYDHLEVSSPGLDRVIKKDKDFIRFSGSKVKVKMLKNYDGPVKLNGILVGADDKFITVRIEEEIHKLPRELVSIVRLFPEY